METLHYMLNATIKKDSELKEFESDTYRIVNDEKTLSIIKTDFLEFNKEKGYYNEI